MPTPFKYHQDPGHGWLEVHHNQIVDNGLSPRTFSRYSYISARRDVLYLEEDCDLTIFATAYLIRHPGPLPIQDVYHETDCFIRNLDRL